MENIYTNSCRKSTGTIPGYQGSYNAAGTHKKSSLKKTMLHLLLLLVGLGFSVSCNEDKFLDITNENELNSENFYSKVDNFDMSLNAVYSAVKSLDLFGQAYYVETLLALPHESDYWNAQSRNEVNSTDGWVYKTWRGWYRVIARANDVIENVPGFIEDYDPAGNELDRLDKILGQAHFMRAFSYFHLVRLWGEASYAVDRSALAVPLILKVASTREDMMQPRATVEEVYNQIIADFEIAGDKLPETWDANNIARVNKNTAVAFLGKTYLYMGDDNRAKFCFETILGNAAYALVPFERYDDLFQGKNEFSEESIFELNYTIDMEQNIWENGLGSGIALSCAPPGRGWSNVTPHGMNIFRFGSDPRLHICTYAPDDLAADINGNMVAAGKSEFNYTGHSFRKYVPQDYSVYSTNRNSGTNYIIMRLADIYLMYAEVMHNLGTDGVASEYMNKVRRRAYGFPPDVPEPTVDYAGLTGTQLRDSIREERFRELFAEGHRWFDIVRWGIVEKEILQYNKYNVTQGLIIYNPRDYYYPIPLAEVDNNVNMVPSTGY
jgi:tetratricopeptide (TPR) repeat protein